MRQFKFGSALLMTVILAGCGGGSDVPAKPRFSAQVSFGDSLSDVGTYKVPAVTAYGGGQFTINPAPAVPSIPTNWTELTAPLLGLAAPCAAVTGGYGTARNPSTGSTPGCYAYGQGGSRVTSQPGVGNSSGALTEPVATQIANHISTNGNFKGDEIVFVMAGANDVFTQYGAVGLGLAPASAVQAVQTAANELANDVTTQIIGNGAKYVAVINVPDIADTPFGVSQGSANQSFVDTLVTTFNAQLKADLPDSANVLNVDAYSASKDEIFNPGKYLLSNTAAPACDIASLPGNSSLFCSAATLSYTDPYLLFADSVHPTPYGHLLFATYVLQAMTNKGWY